MRIELLTSRAGQTGADHAGDVIDVPADEATRLINSGQAIAVLAASDGGVVETTMIDGGGETATTTARNPLRRRK